MDYINSNKEAWEEAFDHRKAGWGEDIAQRLKSEAYPFLEKVLIDELLQLDFTDKSVAQFCCNNGRELLSIMKLGAKAGVGFDIAENMIAFANQTAKTLEINCSFVAANILEIDEKFNDSFDYIFITIGAITWFKDLTVFFKKVSDCLRKDGMLIINEMHPVVNMLGAEGEENYDPTAPNMLVNSYFKKEPWIEGGGMGYISGEPYESKTFYSYSHTFADIINAISQNNMCLTKLMEFDYDISTMFGKLDYKGIPLSYILICRRL